MDELLFPMLIKKYPEIIKKYQALKEDCPHASSTESEHKASLQVIKKMISAICIIENNDAACLGTTKVDWSSKANLLTKSVMTCIGEMITEELENRSPDIINELSHIIGIIYEEFNNIHVEEIMKNYRMNERHLLASIISAQENERRRLASILHDDVVQSMVGLLLRFSLLKKHNINDQLSNELDEMEEILRKTVQMCRVINFETDSFWLEKTGFIAALELFINNFVQKNEIDVELDCHDFKGELTNAVETHLFRVIQEALQNVKKHARASWVNILLGIKENKVYLSIQDNGSGFDYNLLLQDLEQKEVKDHFGLLSIEHRTKILNGKLDIRSIPNEGTLLSVEIPLDNIRSAQVEEKQKEKNVSTWIKSVKASLCAYR